MAAQPRTGFARRLPSTSLGEAFRKAERRSSAWSCPGGKLRYGSEADAVEALVRVRKDRVASADPRPHESHLYPCTQCGGWHLSSTPVLLANDVIPDLSQRHGEPAEMHIRRLQNRIAEQRAQILSMLATGNGGTNRETRKRIASLTAALARVTELWQEERANREALVARLDGRSRRRWFRGGAS